MALTVLDAKKHRRTNMSKPPPSGPHSDLDGVHRDELKGREAVVQAENDPADLKIAMGYGKGHPNDIEEQNGGAQEAPSSSDIS